LNDSLWCTFWFGDRSSCIDPDSIRGQICPIFNNFPVKNIIFQHQVHDIHGHAVTPDTLELYKRSLAYDGDYLLTNIPGVAMGVLTADCLPIAIADVTHKAVGMVHAGWRGSVGGIVRVAIDHMQKLYGTQAHDIKIYCGPCAHACCYQVDHIFIKKLPGWAKPALVLRDQKSYFDLLACNILLLNSLGVNNKQIDTSLSKCTICTHEFCSYRRNPGAHARQMSIIWVN